MTSTNYKFPHIAISLIVLILIVFLKIPFISELGDLLWAEDANVFINDIFSYGYKSLIKPYASYIHLYPRIWSLTLLFTELNNAPIYFLAGWIMAVIFTGILLVSVMQSLGFRFYEALFLASLIFLQPSSGEVYFTITNAQWFLGFALGVWFLMRKGKQDTFAEAFLVALMCLTGPFGVLLTPVLLLKFYFFNNMRPNKYLVIIYLLCIFIQIFFIATTNRPSLPIDLNLANWVKAISTFISLGMHGWFKLLALAFWTFLFFLVIKSTQFKVMTKKQESAFMLMCYGFIVYAAGLYACKNAPHIISPIGGGSRYFWIPYATLFTAAILLSRNKLDKYLVYGLVLLICLIGLKDGQVGRLRTDFNANVVFNGINKNDIAVNPFWEAYPNTWKINAEKLKQFGTNYKVYEIKKKDISNWNGQLENIEGGFSIQEPKSDPNFVFKVNQECNNFKYIALAVELSREAPGYSQFFWASHKKDNFTEINSRTRFIGSSRNQIVFAINKPFDITSVRFDPSDDNLKQFIHKVELYCY